jgi:hypothetical protein
MVDPEILLRARKHLRIAHHIPGRIRLRFDPGILEAVPEIKDGERGDLLSGLPGIKDVRLNAAAFSLVVTYDRDKIEPGWWEQLIEGDEDAAAEVVARLRQLAAAP